MQIYSDSDVKLNCLKYFNGDELATSVVMNKYLLKDKEGNFLESSPDEMFDRLANEFYRIEKKYNKTISKDEIRKAFDRFKYIILAGSPMFGIGNDYQISSIANCFLVESPQDSYSSILQKDEDLVNIMKRRGGVGIDLSRLRPNGSGVNNAAKTSDGVTCFMERYSNTTKEVAQSGRRGALLISIDCRHPDLENFINIKRDLKKVTGANISVKWTDEFLKCVKENKEFTLRFPFDVPIEQAKIKKVVKARDVWNQFVKSNWESGEPGCLFFDRITKQSLSDCYVDEGFKTVSTNPCITGDTLIAVADGRNAVSIKQLCDEGIDVPVYSTNVYTGQVQIKIGRNPRKTGTRKEIWKLTLDDGSIFKATPDHKILLKSLEYVELRDLKVGQSIFPFNTFENNKYRQVSNSGCKMKGGIHRNRRQYRLIYEFFNGEINAKDFAIHHSNWNSFDDRICNLIKITHKEHKLIHSEKMIGINNPYYKMSDEWKLNFARHIGKENGRYVDITNEQMIEHGKNIFKENGKLTRKLWLEYKKKYNLPHINSNYRFKNFSNFKSLVIGNHKVVSVEFCGYEDVYNITVDDNNNYMVITKWDDKNYIKSSGICVKNCGELPLNEYGSCILMSINLKSFVKNPFEKTSEFDKKEFDKYVRMAVRLIDDMVDLEIERVDKILSKIDSDLESEEIKRNEKRLWQKIRANYVKGRRVGLGITGLADMIASLNLKYDSEESLEFIEKTFKLLHETVMDENSNLAVERGKFEIWNWDKEKDCHYIKILSESIKEKIKKNGRRNISVTTIAPTGSISILAQTTSGIEPVFKLSYLRRRKMTKEEIESDIKPEFIDNDGIKWISYSIEHHGLKDWKKIHPNKNIKECPYYGCEAGQLNWKYRVNIQSIVQRYISHSISSTINLYKTTTEEEISSIYLFAWEQGCKGITIYRDGSRQGVLFDKNEMKDDIVSTSAPKRPKILECDIHYSTINGKEWIFFVGKLKGKPYDIFGGKKSSIEIAKKFKIGWIVKNGKVNGISTYDLYLGSLEDENERIIIKDIAHEFSPDAGAYTRIISAMLRHGIPINFICEQLHKVDEKANMFTFEMGISRVLKKYIKDGEKSGKKCHQCGGDMRYEGGCVICTVCGNSLCS